MIRCDESMLRKNRFSFSALMSYFLKMYASGFEDDRSHPNCYSNALCFFFFFVMAVGWLNGTRKVHDKVSFVQILHFTTCLESHSLISEHKASNRKTDFLRNTSLVSPQAIFLLYGLTYGSRKISLWRATVVGKERPREKQARRKASHAVATTLENTLLGKHSLPVNGT